MTKTDSLYDIFFGRVGCLATMHQKEQVISPILNEELGIQVIIPDRLNTDEFGTFTGERSRRGDQLEAAKQKALQGLELTGEKLAFASEGSFGPHPYIPYVAMNIELVVMIDLEHDLEIVGEAISHTSNFGQKRIKSVEEGVEFAEKAGFPEHGMIVRSSENTHKKHKIIKGIHSKEELEQAVSLMLKKYPFGQAFVETDMRAMHNPTRMTQIKEATEDLVNKIKHLCPNCSTPGFTLSERKKGLPCMDCGFPTDVIRSHIYSCKKCNAMEEIMFPHGKEKANPSQCMFCNP
ncbi:MAG: hypothetical protein LRY73_02760 [Bacillus sp. (in: Bacteria)]|nr:hypothetical protein [Bacillus sp. (in: firmicutes)]